MQCATFYWTPAAISPLAMLIRSMGVKVACYPTLLCLMTGPALEEFHHCNGGENGKRPSNPRGEERTSLLSPRKAGNREASHLVIKLLVELADFFLVLVPFLVGDPDDDGGIVIIHRCLVTDVGHHLLVIAELLCFRNILPWRAGTSQERKG